NCFYQGYVDGEAGSMAALNLCNGCSGLIAMGGTSFGIEPIPQPHPYRWHAVSRLDKLIPSLSTCNGAIKTTTPFMKPKEHEFLGKRMRRSILTDTKYIELLLVADTSEFQQHGSTTAVNNRLASFVNIADSLFQPLNVRVVLSHLEIWNTTNMINIGNVIGDNLDAFTAYRQSQRVMGVATNSWQLTDHAMLVQHSRGEMTIGLAFLDGMCSESLSSSITHDFSDLVAPVGVVMAHELGHSLGFDHDGRNCVCNHSQPTQCIMHPIQTSSTMWSNCSVAHLETFLRDYDPGCLLNVPHPDNIFTASICGNGITERGEECDCGFPGSCNLRCCNSTSCMLLPTAQCTTGLCCASNCSFEPAGTICRNQSHADCDLPEFCSGTSGECSEDFFRKDSVPCQNGSGVCLSGVCWNRDRQCKESWGSNATVADDICYSINRDGKSYGNCGKRNGQYIACNKGDILCGSLMCNFTPLRSMTVTTYILRVGETRCISFTSPASDMAGVGQVRNGLACGTNKICMGSKCRDIPQNSLECDAMCSTNGVCNNKCHCHCNIGWAPPFCNVTGLGGSVDSG
uniref:Peptidase M12B domain-containing protein n=1 Tax=Ciona savignyi TaxID=51511 RepID=H2YWX6_CIOSA